jgi:hypothetical protein
MRCVPCAFQIPTFSSRFLFYFFFRFHPIPIPKIMKVSTLPFFIHGNIFTPKVTIRATHSERLQKSKRSKMYSNSSCYAYLFSYQISFLESVVHKCARNFHFEMLRTIFFFPYCVSAEPLLTPKYASSKNAPIGHFFWIIICKQQNH